jgi:integrase
LSAKFIERKDLTPGLYGDGDNLYLQVARGGTKSWLHRFMIAGVPDSMGLGSVRRVTLAEARRKAHAANVLLAAGKNPRLERDAARSELAVQRAKGQTFRQVAEGFISAHAHAWKNAKHAKQWTATLEAYAYPVIGSLLVAAIDEAHVMAVLQPIWFSKAETASRVRGRIEKILDRAKALRLRTGDNPARWQGHLDQLLPARSQIAPGKHHIALPYADIPAFMAKLRAHDSIGARALEWTILCAARTGDTLGATWSEIDLSEKLWLVPASRMKNRKGTTKRDHAVPLSNRAMTILADLPREGDFVFTIAGRPLSYEVMVRVLREQLGYAPSRATVHGFRSSFKDWCSEQTGYPNEVSELALAHTVPSKVEASYRRGDMRDRRRRMMADWSDYCAGKHAADENIVPLRGAV